MINGNIACQNTHYHHPATYEFLLFDKYLGNLPTQMLSLANLREEPYGVNRGNCSRHR